MSPRPEDVRPLPCTPLHLYWPHNGPPLTIPSLVAPRARRTSCRSGRRAHAGRPARERTRSGPGPVLRQARRQQTGIAGIHARRRGGHGAELRPRADHRHGARRAGGHWPRRSKQHTRGAPARMSDCHSASDPVVEIRSETRVPLIALAGQPNLGKSTLFNLLTGLNQHVGNWPGKTVERREGRFDLEGETIRLVDLPGTYSLTANSPEEVIAREFIVREQPDVVVAVVSAANLERSLYLLAELLALHAPVVVALNMMDVARQEG